MGGAGNQPPYPTGIHRLPSNSTGGEHKKELKTAEPSSSTEFTSTPREGTPPPEGEDSSRRTDDREIAASVLLLAAAAAENQASGDEAMLATEGSKPPLKKRKKVADVMSKGEAETQPCHVSPVSHNSKTTDSTNATPEKTQRVPSYDLKETPKKTPTSPHVSITIPHFPTVLHQILTESTEQSVIQWLPHGQAWKILRWDALRRQVLPQHFPRLKTVDAFLAHLADWGFEEINAGPDVGAYTHPVRL
jgi:hypothetical protein